MTQLISKLLLLGFFGFCISAIFLRLATQLTLRQCEGHNQLRAFTSGLISLCSFICFVIFYKTFGTSRELLIATITFCVLLFHATTDYLCGVTFDLVTYIFVPALLLIRLYFGTDFFLQGFYSTLAALAVMLVIFLASRGKSGLGDVFVASCVGCGCFSLFECAICLYLAFLLGAVISLALLVAKKITRQTKIPFAPFLFMGYAMGIVLFRFYIE